MKRFYKQIAFLIAFITVSVGGVRAQSLTCATSELNFTTAHGSPVQQEMVIGLSGLSLLNTLTGFDVTITGTNSDQFIVRNQSVTLIQLLTDLLGGGHLLTVVYSPTETSTGNDLATLEIKVQVLGLALPLKLSIPLTGKITDVTQIGNLKDAYLYGFPLVMMELTKQLMTNVETPDQVFAPINQFGYQTMPLSPDFSAVIGANADTYSCNAWLDLSAEPIVVHMPNTNGRYYVFPILDAFTNVFASAGSRTTGTGEQTYLITGPSWQGTVPAGMIELKSPTNLAWVICRILAYNPGDGETVVKSIQDDMSMVPLSQYGNPSYTSPMGTIDPAVSAKPPKSAIFDLSISDYFNLMNELLVANPPASYDSTIIQKMRPLGIGTGLTFNKSDFSLALQLLMNGIPLSALAEMGIASASFSENVNGWSYPKEFIETYGNRYAYRASVAYGGLGANRPDDTVYGSMLLSGSTIVLNGSLYNYTMHFDAGQLPPVDPSAFWSVTPYNTNGQVIANAIDRYSIGSRDSLYINPDGSLDIYLQDTDPGGVKTRNWLPIPDSIFGAIIRLYWPDEVVLEKEWYAPAMQASLKILSRSEDATSAETLSDEHWVYPNPVTDVLYIKEAVEEVTVYSIGGQLIYKDKEVSTILVSDWTSGVYIVVLKTKAGMQQYKVIKR